MKKQGITGSEGPIGDSFAIDLVTHEIGHQFGDNHMQNKNCNINVPNSVEPGSGSSIMGYAGICPPNIQNNSNAYFHAVNIQEMYITNTSPLKNCSVYEVTHSIEPIASNSGILCFIHFNNFKSSSQLFYLSAFHQ